MLLVPHTTQGCLKATRALLWDILLPVKLEFLGGPELLISLRTQWLTVSNSTGLHFLRYAKLLHPFQCSSTMML